MLVNNQVKMEGFVVYNFVKEFQAAREEMGKWVRSKQLKAWTTNYNGLNQAPQAFVDMLGGKTKGTTIVNVGL